MMRVNGEAKEQTIEVTIIRADGRVEHLGVVAYWNKNPIRRHLWRLWRNLKW